MSMMSDNEDSQVATTSKGIQKGGNDEDAEMDDVEEKEELMVSLDNISRTMFQKT